MPRPEGQPIPASAFGETPDGASSPSAPPMPESDARAEAAKKPLDWNPAESAKLTVLAKEVAALRDKITAKKSTPAEELRLKKLVAEIKGMIDSKKSGRAKREQESRPEGVTTPEEAERIMGPDFFGPEAIGKAFGFQPEYVTDVPYTIEQLEQAKKLGEMLVLRVSKIEPGQPLTVGVIQKLYESLTVEKLLASDWRTSLAPAAQEVVRPGWALVSKDVLPGSTGRNYFEQTMVLYDRLVQIGALPDDEAEREKLATRLTELAELQKTNWQEAAKQAAELPINAKYRRKLIEQVYDLAVSQAGSGNRLLPNKNDWGSSRRSDGGLLSVGGFDAKGAGVGVWRADDTHDGFGVCSSR